ncbi:MAG: efflux RND transporter permease subunit [Rubricella sp.]
MTGIVDWAASRARMILAFVLVSLVAGWTAYVGLPKEGEPDIDVPVLVVTAPLPGVSAEDAETLLVRPLEQELSDLDGLTDMTATAAEGVAIIVLEFEFGWDKNATIADTRDRVDRASAQFPSDADEPTISEINFSEFPILTISLSGEVPQRTLFRLANDLQDELESMGEVLEAGLAGYREEMIEVILDPLRLEAYDVTAQDLINVVVNNNQLVAAGEVTNGSGAFAVKIPSSFDSPEDIYDLPVTTNGDRVVTLGDLADIRLTFEDEVGTARYNGEPTVAIQVVKTRGVNIIETVALVRERVEAQVAEWPEPLRAAVRVDFSMDESINVGDMVRQLEGSVLTAIALVMIVVLAALGSRSALLVGFAIPTSFLLTFAAFAALEFPVSNIVMFGLILAVGMLVDGAIVVVEYADKRIQRGDGPMHAYTAAAKRMFWPIVSSTATTLCAFLPLVLWPGLPGEFMGMLPITLIFVLTSSLIVALIYLPVVGGVAGRFSRFLEGRALKLHDTTPLALRAALMGVAAVVTVAGLVLTLRAVILPGLLLTVLGLVLITLAGSSFRARRVDPVPRAGYRRTLFGRFIAVIVSNPIMPIVTLVGVLIFAVGTFSYYSENNNGVEFFVETEPERAVAYVRARGNLSLDEADRLLWQAEQVILGTEGVDSVFAFAGNGGLNQAGDGGSVPNDTIGQIQIELESWRDRGDGNAILDDLNARLSEIPGIVVQITEQAQGPGQGKPVHLRLTGNDFDDLIAATATVRERFDATPGLIDQEDNRPLPGIDWQINVDVEAAGRYGADVATVGGMVQLVTRGLLLDTMRTDDSDEEIEIRVRFPEEDRRLETLDTLRVRTNQGLVPLANFISREPAPQLAEIRRIDGERYFDVLADVRPGLVAVVAPGTEEEPERVVEVISAEDAEARAAAFAEEGLSTRVITPTERIAVLTEWLEGEGADALPPGVSWTWTGDQEEQEESATFLGQAMLGALALMFIILLAQFNSLYNSVVVLVAVVFSIFGVLIGMIVMDQAFSIIMTGTGILALAGIVVNNNIVLIDTYQGYARFLPRLEAIVRTAEARIRPVLLTTITTIAGLTPMVIGLSLDFIGGGYTLNSPTALWWKQLATAVVFGLGTATFLTLLVTPALLALRVWISFGVFGRRRFDGATGSARKSADRDLKRRARGIRDVGDIDWTAILPNAALPEPGTPPAPGARPLAAE